MSVKAEVLKQGQPCPLRDTCQCLEHVWLPQLGCVCWGEARVLTASLERPGEWLMSLGAGSRTAARCKGFRKARVGCY